jgi:hypothetical protein
VAVDPTGELAGGGPEVAGPEDLRTALVADPEQLIRALTEKLMTFALGRGLEYYDMPAVRAIVRRAADSGYRFESIVRGIVASDAFRMRAVPAPENEVVASRGGGNAGSAGPAATGGN